LQWLNQLFKFDQNLKPSYNMKNSTQYPSLFEILLKQGAVFYQKFEKLEGTVTYKDGKFMFLPEFRRGFEITEDQAKEICKNQ
jgi:hypothetical protein